MIDWIESFTPPASVLWWLLPVALFLWSCWMGVIVGGILRANRLELEHQERERRRAWHG